MRGIGKGQTVTMLVIPEVQQLINRQLTKAGYPDGRVSMHPDPQRTALLSISA